MISIEALRDEREESYKVWFERWWDKADIESRIISNNAKGFTSISIDTRGGNEYRTNRLRDDLFILQLEQKLPGFVIYRTRDLLRAVIISWATYDEPEE